MLKLTHRLGVKVVEGLWYGSDTRTLWRWCFLGEKLARVALLIERGLGIHGLVTGNEHLPLNQREKFISQAEVWILRSAIFVRNRDFRPRKFSEIVLPNIIPRWIYVWRGLQVYFWWNYDGNPSKYDFYTLNGIQKIDFQKRKWRTYAMVLDFNTWMQG